MARRRLSLVTIYAIGCLSLCATAAAASPLFEATVPGSWALYEAETEGSDPSTDRWIRHPDRDGSVTIELLSTYASGPAAGTEISNLYVLDPTFDFANEGLSYGKALLAATLRYGEGPALVQPEAVVDAIRAGMKAFGPLEPIGREEVGGRECDRYAYTAEGGGVGPFSETGTICLDPSIPFAVVHQEGTGKNPDGTVLFQISRRLVDFGIGATDGESPPSTSASSTASGIEAGPSTGPLGPYGLQEAYDQGFLSLTVRPDPTTGGLLVTAQLVNETDRLLQLAIKTEMARLDASFPAETLSLLPAHENRIDLAPGGETKPLQFRQVGTRGPIDGTFRIIMYEGSGLFQGSVTMGTLGEPPTD